VKKSLSLEGARYRERVSLKRRRVGSRLHGEEGCLGCRGKLLRFFIFFRILDYDLVVVNGKFVGGWGLNLRQWRLLVTGRPSLQAVRFRSLKLEDELIPRRTP